MGLFDMIFRRSKTPITTAAGSNGVNVMAGTLVTYEESPDLQGRNLYTTLSNAVANTQVLGTGVRYYQNLLAGTAWTVTPNEDAGADGERAAELVRTGMLEANMPDAWSTVVKRAALFRMYGFSLHEWTMRKRGDGALVYASIEHRPQSTIQYWDIPDKGGPMRGVIQQPLMWSDYYYLDRGRLFYCVDNALTDAPDGVGMLRHVIQHARRLSRLEQLEMFTYDTDMRGIPVARIPYQELTKFQKAYNLPDSWVQAQIKPMRDLVQNHIKTPWQGITMDSAPYKTEGESPTISQVPQWALDLIKGDGAGLPEVAKAIERVNLEMARALGMEFMMLGGNGEGSLALSRDKTSMFATVLESALHELAEFARRDLVWPLLTLNGMDPEKVAPKLSPDPIATERIEVTVDALQKLALAGAVMMPDDPAINQIRQRLHLAEQPKLPPDVMAGIRAGFDPMAGKVPPGGKTGNPDDGAEDDSVDPNDGSGGKNKPKTKKLAAATFYTDQRKSSRVTYDLNAMSYDELQAAVCRISSRDDGFYATTKRADGRTTDIGGPYSTLSSALARVAQYEKLELKAKES